MSFIREQRGLLALCLLNVTIIFSQFQSSASTGWRSVEDKTKCPKVKGIRNFNIAEVTKYTYVLRVLYFIFFCLFVRRRGNSPICVFTFSSLKFLGSWNVMQYYASSEEALAYRCMRADLSVQYDNFEITMNFTYNFVDDPINERLFGNITWKIPSPELPAHWVHAENPCEFGQFRTIWPYNIYIYNTYCNYTLRIIQHITL